MEDDSSDDEPEQLQCKLILLGDGAVRIASVPLCLSLSHCFSLGRARFLGGEDLHRTALHRGPLRDAGITHTHTHTHTSSLMFSLTRRLSLSLALSRAPSLPLVSRPLFISRLSVNTVQADHRSRLLHEEARAARQASLPLPLCARVCVPLSPCTRNSATAAAACVQATSTSPYKCGTSGGSR